MRPPSFEPINGKVVSGSSDARTRARVVAGRLWVMIRSSSLATAGSARTTDATGSKVFERHDVAISQGTTPLERALVCARDGVQERGHGLGIRIGLIESRG